MKRKTKKVNKKVFFLELNPYEHDCVVVVDGEFSDAINALKKENSKNGNINIKNYEENKKDFPDDFMSSSNKGRLYYSLPYGYIMLLKKNKESWTETVAVVAHESLHLVSYLFRKVGINLTEESEEAYTYLLEDTVRKITMELYL